MNTYILLVNFTQQGIQTIKDSPKRLEATKKAIEAAGGAYKGWYLTFGQYDAVFICEAPNDEAVARLLLATAGLGNVRTQTLRAFNEQEYRDIIASLP